MYLLKDHNYALKYIPGITIWVCSNCVVESLYVLQISPSCKKHLRRPVGQSSRVVPSWCWSLRVDSWGSASWALIRTCGSVREAPVTSVVTSWSGGHLDNVSAFACRLPFLYSTVKLNCCRNSNQRASLPPVSLSMESHCGQNSNFCT